MEYDLSGIRDADKICYEPCSALDLQPPRLSATADVIIQATGLVGVPQLTPKTLPMLYERLATYERMFGPLRLCSGPDGKPAPAYFTYEEVARFVGLRTTAISVNDAVWMLGLRCYILREVIAANNLPDDSPLAAHLRDLEVEHAKQVGPCLVRASATRNRIVIPGTTPPRLKN